MVVKEGVYYSMQDMEHLDRVIDMIRAGLVLYLKLQELDKDNWQRLSLLQMVVQYLILPVLLLDHLIHQDDTGEQVEQRT